MDYTLCLSDLTTDPFLPNKHTHITDYCSKSSSTMEGNKDPKLSTDSLNSNHYSKRLIMTYNVFFTIILMLSFTLHTNISKNISGSFQALTSELNIKKYSNHTITCKASIYNPKSNLNTIGSKSNNLDNNYILYKALTKLTDRNLKNSAEKGTSKILSAFPNYITNIDSTDIKPTYLDREKFSTPVECVNPTKNPITSVKSMKNNCKNITKCIHVLHLGFALVTSVFKRTPPRSPKQLLVITCPYGDLIKVVLIEEPGSSMFPHWENKYTHKVARLENNLQVTCQYRIKMQVFSNLNGKSTSLRTWTHYTIYGEPSLSGIYHKKDYKKPKYQPLKCTRLAGKIIMINHHHTRCIHIHDPPYRLWLL